MLPIRSVFTAEVQIPFNPTTFKELEIAFHNVTKLKSMLFCQDHLSVVRPRPLIHNNHNNNYHNHNTVAIDNDKSNNTTAILLLLMKVG